MVDNSWALFENDVEMYGTQTLQTKVITHCEFENDVEMYGTQTVETIIIIQLCLRMM